MFPAHPRLAFPIPPKNQLSKYWELGQQPTGMWEATRVCLLGKFQKTDTEAEVKGSWSIPRTSPKIAVKTSGKQITRSQTVNNFNFYYRKNSQITYANELKMFQTTQNKVNCKCGEVGQKNCMYTKNSD